MNILAVSGDVGGVQALIPVLKKMQEQHIAFKIVDHLSLGDADDSWSKLKIDTECEDNWGDLLLEEQIEVLIFTTSVKDLFPLKLAKKAKEIGIRVICLLDNWMNYSKRLELNGSIFLPDKYLLMDQIAYDGAVHDNITESILEITGQPALSIIHTMHEEYSSEMKAKRLQELGIDQNRKLIIFISEPAEDDQGKDARDPGFRGYTEKTVLKSLSESLQQFSQNIFVGLIPHPREKPEELLNTWNECRGDLQGGFLQVRNSREAVMLADGVCGMTSILLYEAWLIYKPTISIQPNVQIKDLLALFQNRDGVFCVNNIFKLDTQIKDFMELVYQVKEQVSGIRDELYSHSNAVDNILQIIDGKRP